MCVCVCVAEGVEVLQWGRVCHDLCDGGQGTAFFELFLFFHLVKANSDVSAVLCYGIQVT